MKSSKKKREESKIIITGIILAVVVVIVCSVGFVMLRNYIKFAENNSTRRYQRLSEAMQTELERTEKESKDETEGQEAVSEVIQGDAQVLEAPKVTVLPQNQLLLPEQGGLSKIEASAIPYQEPVAVSLTPLSQVDLSGYYPVAVSSCAASSTLYIPGVDTDAEMMFDGDYTTSWQEGVDGLGEGSIVNAKFDRVYYIRYLVLRLGNWGAPSFWEENSTPSNITVWIGGNGYSINFPNEMTEWVLTFSEEVVASEVSFTINSSYAGTYEDTCISDAIVFGR